MLKIAICDDDIHLCAELESLIIAEYPAQFKLRADIETFYEGEDLIHHLETGNHFDLLFLDIVLDKTNGIVIGKYIRENLKDEKLQIVYISSFKEKAIELFDIRPLNFLIKPLNREKIQEVLLNVIRLLNDKEHVFIFQKGQELCRRYLDEIIYFTSENRKIMLVSSDGIESFYGKLDKIRKKLEPYGFIQIHKSYLVNYQYIAAFQYDQIQLFNSVILPISQAKRKEIRELQLKIERDNI